MKLKPESHHLRFNLTGLLWRLSQRSFHFLLRLALPNRRPYQQRALPIWRGSLTLRLLLRASRLLLLNHRLTLRLLLSCLLSGGGNLLLTLRSSLLFHLLTRLFGLSLLCASRRSHRGLTGALFLTHHLTHFTSRGFVALLGPSRKRRHLSLALAITQRRLRQAIRTTHDYGFALLTNLQLSWEQWLSCPYRLQASLTLVSASAKSSKQEHLTESSKPPMQFYTALP